MPRLTGTLTGELVASWSDVEQSEAAAEQRERAEAVAQCEPSTCCFDGAAGGYFLPEGRASTRRTTSGSRVLKSLKSTAKTAGTLKIHH